MRYLLLLPIPESERTLYYYRPISEGSVKNEGVMGFATEDWCDYSVKDWQLVYDPEMSLIAIPDCGRPGFWREIW